MATVFCMSATPFTEDNRIDEVAFRLHLRRLIEAGNGVYLGSGGAGETHALSQAELQLIYAVGVEECRGRVPVYANPPEARTADAMLSNVELAVSAGVDVVQLYPVDAGHGMRPTDEEQERYFRQLLDAIDHPIALSVHVAVGYVTPVPLLRRLVASYPQIVALNLMGTPISYLVEAMDAVGPGVATYTPIATVLQGLLMGAQGCLAAEPNLAPRLCQSVVGLYESGHLSEAGLALCQVVRLANIVNRWAPSTARWVKMGLQVLQMPGGNGILRPPYLLPSSAERRQMADAFVAMNLTELEGLAPIVVS
jgi:dihydrodipicolinate synthase/N-acetylneuraminate lyase